MKSIVLLAFSLCFSNLLFGQKTQEKLFVKDINCEYDTLNWVYTKSDVKIENEETKEIVITDGNKKILFIKLFTDKCECSDCSEYHHLALTIDSLKKNELYYFKSSDVKWVYGNSWTSPKYVTTYLGNILMTDEKNYEIRISELLGSTVIRNINLKVENGK